MVVDLRNRVAASLSLKSNYDSGLRRDNLDSVIEFFLFSIDGVLDASVIRKDSLTLQMREWDTIPIPGRGLLE
jgi:hypothetical protein